MRGLIPGLETPHPMQRRLPALYQEDDLSLRLVGALDGVLAPIICTLDNAASYFDAQECPADFVPWLAGWVGVALDENWPTERQRSLVAQAGDLYRSRGTVHGLRALVAIYTGTEPEIEESGAAGWSAKPGAKMPGSSKPKLLVRIQVQDGSAIDPKRVETIVRAAKPAHMPHSVEVVTQP